MKKNNSRHPHPQNYLHPQRRYLKKYHGQMVNCIGTFIETGYKHIKQGAICLGYEVMLLRNIFERSGKFHIDHLWIPINSETDINDLQSNDKVIFSGKIIQYFKGRNNQQISFGIADIFRFKKSKKFVLNSMRNYK